MFLTVSDYAWLDFTSSLGSPLFVPFLFILAFLGDRGECLRWRGAASGMSRLRCSRASSGHSMKPSLDG